MTSKTPKKKSAKQLEQFNAFYVNVDRLENSRVIDDEELTKYIIPSDVENDDLVDIVPDAVPLTEVYIDNESKVRHCVSTSRKNLHLDTPKKTVLVVGETGTGKTKFIDGMFNYLAEVKWDEDFRWKLTYPTPSEKSHSTNEAQAQTEYITVYSTPRFIRKIPFAFDIIDTPGFGDSLEKDQALRSHLKDFFCAKESKHGVKSLDAVCIIATASNPRLTPTQEYVYDSILSIFGNDVKSNIFAIATNADNSTPKVFKAMMQKGIPIKATFKVNNVALYAANDKSALANKLNWQMSESGYEGLINEIMKVETISTLQTKEVLEKREQLMILLEEISKMISSNMTEMCRLMVLNKKLEKHIDEMEQNQNFSITVTEEQDKQVANKFLATTLFCKKCKRQCHYPCVPFQILKRFCVVFSKGKCQACKLHGQGCSMDDHDHRDTHMEKVTVSVNKTLDDIKARFESAQHKVARQSDMMDCISQQCIKIKKKILADVGKAHEYHKELNKIALTEDPVTKIDIINHILATELVSPSGSEFLGQYYKVMAELYNDILTDTLTVDSIRDRMELDRYLKQSKLYASMQSKKVS